jgi:hypothetical protein
LDIQAGDILDTRRSAALFQAQVAEYGFAYVENTLSDDVMARLQAEATMRAAAAKPAEGSGDNPYRSSIAEIGSVACSFLNSPSVASLLRSTLGGTFMLSQKASCYTYYGSGSFLGRHLDRQEACAATLIVYLEAVTSDPPPRDTGLVLWVFGEDVSHEAEPHLTVPTRRGTLVVGRGARFWHERPLLQPGERVVALTACFTECD